MRKPLDFLWDRLALPMPYAYDSVNMIVQAFERGQNPAVYLRQMRTYEGTAGLLTKAPGSGNVRILPLMAARRTFVA